MGKLKDDSNIQIYGWMATKLKLKGNELLIYAVIYSFSRNDNGNGVFNASTAYLCEWTNLTKRNVLNCLSSLVNKNLIVKLEDNLSKRKPNVYVINKFTLYNTGEKNSSALVKNFHQTDEKISPVQVKKQHQTGEKISPNNNIINTKYNTKINPNNNITNEEKALGKVCELYAKEITGKLCCSPHEVKRLTELAEEHGVENVEKAINKAVEYNKKSLVYINGILSKNGSKAKKRALPDEYDIPF